MTDSKPRRTAWLYGPTTDLLLGCGGGSIALTLAVASLGTGALREFVPLALLLAAFSIPHYGATMVRVYDEAKDPKRHAWVSWGASAALAVLFVLSLHAPLLGSILLTVYLTWSPWHYTAQNFGIVSMMLGRRGVKLDTAGRAALRTSFRLSFLMTFFAIHGSERAANYTPVPYFDSVYSLIRLGIPVSLSLAVIGCAAIGYIVLSGLAIRSMLRAPGGSLRSIFPALALMATQAIWFVLPAALRASGIALSIPAFNHVYSQYGFLWIAAAHAIQYLWITSYFHCVARAEQRRSGAHEPLLFIAKSASAGFALWVLPVLFFAPGHFGTLPSESGLALMAAAMINLHHFILDGAIWKLRSGPVAHELFSDIVESTKQIRRLPWLAPALYGAGIIALLIHAASWYEGEYGFRRSLAENRPERAKIALERLELMGGASPSKHMQLGYHYRAIGETRLAVREFRSSVRLHPGPDAWFGLGTIFERNENWFIALQAFSNAKALGRNTADVVYRIGLAQLNLGRGREAEASLVRALESTKEQVEREKIRSALERARSIEIGADRRNRRDR